MNKTHLILKFENILKDHFQKNHCSIRIPFYDDIVAGALESGTVMAAAPMFNVLDVSLEEWQTHLKIKQYNKDFEVLVNE